MSSTILCVRTCGPHIYARTLARRERLRPVCFPTDPWSPRSASTRLSFIVHVFAVVVVGVRYSARAPGRSGCRSSRRRKLASRLRPPPCPGPRSHRRRPLARSDGRPRWVVVSARRKELRRERRPSRRRLGVLPGAPGHRRDATVDVIRESHRRQAGEKWVHVSLDDESADTRINRLTDNDIRDNDIRRVYSTPRKPSSSTLASPTARTPPLPPSSRAIATPEGTGQGKRGCKAAQLAWL
mmetsp:Transcript_2794/g.9341  ORF Transcript_2794/g.9341 Transcript_2794/m.9341 type:complete len:240 (-) Transcript_2794:83-802(-)